MTGCLRGGQHSNVLYSERLPFRRLPCCGEVARTMTSWGCSSGGGWTWTVWGGQGGTAGDGGVPPTCLSRFGENGTDHIAGSWSPHSQWERAR